MLEYDEHDSFIVKKQNVILSLTKNDQAQMAPNWSQDSVEHKNCANLKC